jgi:hypothetical protein
MPASTPRPAPIAAPLRALKLSFGPPWLAQAVTKTNALVAIIVGNFIIVIVFVSIEMGAQILRLGWGKI